MQGVRICSARAPARRTPQRCAGHPGRQAGKGRLLGVDFVLNTVPEPAALDMFGLGLLLLGLFVVLRRRHSR